MPSRRGSVWMCGWICGSTSWKPNSRERTRPSSATHNRRSRWTSYGAGAHHDRRTVDIEDQLMRALLRVPGMRKYLTRWKPETNEPQHMRERRDRINSVAKCAEELGNALSCPDNSLRFGGCISDRHPRNPSQRFLLFLSACQEWTRSCLISCPILFDPRSMSF